MHPFDDPRFQGAHLLFVQGNFGCGSSREHAPQAIARWGIRAIVGESFAEIFFGNALMMGLPCVTADRVEIERLISFSETHPDVEYQLDLGASCLSARDLTIPVSLPEGARSALLSGNWDATGLLIDRYEEVEQTAAGLPYVSGWGTR